MTHHLSPLTHYLSGRCSQKPQGPKIGEQQPRQNDIRQAILWDEIYNIHICYFLLLTLKTESEREIYITLLNAVKQVFSGENGTMSHASDSAFGNLFSSLSLFTNTHDKC